MGKKETTNTSNVTIPNPTSIGKEGRQVVLSGVTGDMILDLPLTERGWEWGRPTGGNAGGWESLENWLHEMVFPLRSGLC